MVKDLHQVDGLSLDIDLDRFYIDNHEQIAQLPCDVHGFLLCLAYKCALRPGAFRISVRQILDPFAQRLNATDEIPDGFGYGIPLIAIAFGRGVQ
jgi:hypothetical protein